MTAIVGILNKKAAVMAADSALPFRRGHIDFLVCPDILELQYLRTSF